MLEKTKDNKEKNSILELIMIICFVLIAFSGTIEPLLQIRNIVYIAILAISFLMILLGKHKIKFNNIIQLQWSILLLFIVFNTIYTIDTKKLYIVILQYIAYTAILMLNFNSKFYKRLMDVFLVICTILGIIVIITIFNKNFIPDNFYFLYPESTLKSIIGRTSANAYGGILGEVAYSAFAMNIGIAIIVSKYFSKQKLTIMNWFQLMIFIVGVMVAFKRSLLLIPIFIVLILFLISNREHKLKKGISFLVIIIGIIISILAIFPQSLDTIGRFTKDTTNGGILNGREELWRYSFDMYERNPILGLGFSSYTTYCYSQGFKWDYLTHNIYIELLGEVGIVGTLIFLIFFINTLRVTFKIIKKEEDSSKLELLNFSLFIQILFLMYGLSGNTLYFPQQMIVYILAISIVTKMISMKKE